MLSESLAEFAPHLRFQAKFEPMVYLYSNSGQILHDFDKLRPRSARVRPKQIGPDPAKFERFRRSWPVMRSNFGRPFETLRNAD